MSDFDSCQSNHTHTDGLHNRKASQVVQDLLWHLTSAYMKCVYSVWIVYEMLLPMVLRCALRGRESSATMQTNYIQVIM